MQTFQNLCVIAHMDGGLHPAERDFLEEVAGGMGLTQEEVANLMAQGSRLEFIIPQTEGERYLELRMVIVMMLTDGKMDDREYQGCLHLAEEMGIEQAYLDETIGFYQKKQAELAGHLAIFQNLYLIAAADGHISEQEKDLLLEVARNLGLGQEDIDGIIDSDTPLEFILPEGKEDRFFSLKNLVYMMVVDGKIAPEEYDLCVEFARKVELGQSDVDEIIEEYRQLRTEREAHQEEVTVDNTDYYLDLINAFNRIGLDHNVCIQYFQLSAQSGRIELPPHLDTDQQLAFLRVLWLIYVRCYELCEEAETQIPLYISLAAAKQELQDLFNFLIQQERENGASGLTDVDLSHENVEAELSQQLRNLLQF